MNIASMDLSGRNPGSVLMICLNLLLALALAYAISTHFQTIPQLEKATRMPSAGATPAPFKQANSTDVASLHLFGLPGQAVATNTLPAAETSLNLVLRGVLMVDDKNERRAYIADENGSDKAYRIGDELASGAVVHDIYEDKVILRHRGKNESLSLAGSKDGDRVQYQRQSQLAGQSPNPVIPGLRSPGSKLGNLRIMTPSLPSPITLDSQALARQVNALPVMQDGKLSGFRLNAGRESALLQQLGIRSSDIITAINGQSLSDPSAAAGLLSSLQGGQTLNITVKRNGREQNIPLTLK